MGQTARIIPRAQSIQVPMTNSFSLKGIIVQSQKPELSIGTHFHLEKQKYSKGQKYDQFVNKSEDHLEIG
jgi:hypothetical protein